MDDAALVRAFVAIDIPNAECERAFALSKRLRKAGVRVSWTPPERMHLTLRFLGEVAPDVIAGIAERLETEYAGVEPFPLRLEGAGALPNAREARVIWVGLAPLAGPLEQVQEAAESAAREAGLKREKRPFRPHLTVGRVRDPKKAGALAALIHGERNFSGDEFAVSSVSLYESQLTPSGPIYNRLHEFPFRWKS